MDPLACVVGMMMTERLREIEGLTIMIDVADATPIVVVRHRTPSEGLIAELAAMGFIQDEFLEPGVYTGTFVGVTPEENTMTNENSSAESAQRTDNRHADAEAEAREVPGDTGDEKGKATNGGAKTNANAAPEQGSWFKRNPIATKILLVAGGAAVAAGAWWVLKGKGGSATTNELPPAA